MSLEAPRPTGDGGDDPLAWVTIPALAEVLGQHPGGALPATSARALYRLVRRIRPSAALEIGLGQGASTLAVLQALQELGGGRLVCVEQRRSAPGLARLRSSGLLSQIELHLQPSHLALPRLLQKGVRIQFAFLDGRHLFDYLLVDLFYCDLLLDVGGVLVCDDARWPGLEKAVRFFESNRAYERVGGLPRRLAALRKLGDDQRGRRTGRLRNDFEGTGKTFVDF
ncbi:MAG TPA: class I SAM-dependent methyltransferase [Candidatus Acidoferrales bacterium]|nr:class I SAM-dependent methyltransferase [Candidatus Acidoferrales bacterium]